MKYQQNINFFELYETTGWNKEKFTADDLFYAINNSWYLAAAYEGEQLVGFGRIISDGIYQTFIGHMIVHPSYHGQGIGKEVMTRLLNKCESSGIKWVQLTCAHGKSGFYKKFRFEERPLEGPGMQKYL
ncbi:GNAT family N-acetyltransferase [Bacillus shivajii]|uniref:GNAT family N-acetyltransferase n=1 Tax=Bacillus shivajii TaxID=1983719 RepID=UPI001CFAD4BE|nr:GNAT family N-acetyltransferase [Bacillus shivajii]UCZ52785.1 GNAT family N-acetyltransferase [Bacillus shivajii]